MQFFFIFDVVFNYSEVILALFDFSWFRWSSFFLRISKVFYVFLVVFIFFEVFSTDRPAVLLHSEGPFGLVWGFVFKPRKV